MDLEHPDITSAHLTGYPRHKKEPAATGTYQKYTCADYSTSEDDLEMTKTLDDLIFDVLHLCVENDLNFNYQSNIGLIDVTDANNDFENVGRGYIKRWKLETPRESVLRILEEVREYLNE